MSIYKVSIKKTVFVEAETKEEAIDIAFDDEICSDEVIECVVKSTRKDMANFMRGY